MSLMQRLVAHCGAGRTLQEAMARDGLFRWPPGRGKDWHVDTELGTTGNSGERADDAFSSITQALTKCVAQRGDNIIVQRWATDNDETWPLPMSVEGVALIGVLSGVLTPYQDSLARIVCPDNTAVIALTAHRCRIMSLSLQCPVGYDAITFAVNGWTGIIGNHFAICKDAIGGGAGAGTSIGWQSEISRNYFGSQVADHGIYQFNPANLLIWDNLFQRVGGVCALKLESAGSPRIIDNRFGVASDVKGGAITLGRDVNRALVDNNRANHDKTAMSANPFLDTSTGGAPPTYNDWLMNYHGVTATMPATV